MVTIGSDVQIKCAAAGRPRPTITWRINGQLIEGMLLADHRPAEQEMRKNTVCFLHMSITVQADTQSVVIIVTERRRTERQSHLAQ